ncbi:MAG: UDP-3-O-(3-hydroxymyristoyl)glucosamine N-acyltransferase [Thermodesulfovibrionales bacterium]|nr:UDP-3-O-(3-hydroxymyristoyl)glucosamine N-acyltransferase [Thermodesulfovibrionales bacterium]
MKLRELASLIHGEIIGDESIEITGASGIREAKKGEITFLSARKYLKDLAGSGASCVIVREPLTDIPVAQVKVPNPQLAFAKLLEHFYVKRHVPAGVSADAYISGTARIAEGVSVYPFCYVSAGVSLGKRTVVYPHVFIGEDSAIGEDCILHPNVTVREKVRIGDRVIIHSGAVIGSDGFGYVFDQGIHHKIPQVGGVIVADDVEIGANVSIDRATTGDTLIGSGTKIDNLVQIAHNVKIGRNSLIISQVGIAGSAEIGDYVTLAGQVGVADHTHIESETIFGAQAGAMGHVAKGIYSGSPGIPHREWLKAQAVYAKLPELQKKVRALEAKIKELEKEES